MTSKPCTSCIIRCDHCLQIRDSRRKAVADWRRLRQLRQPLLHLTPQGDDHDQ